MRKKRRSGKEWRLATTVRVEDEVAATLRDLAKEEHRPIGKVIEAAVAHYQREKFWREVEISLERLRSDPVAWQDYQDEIQLFNGASMDGLSDEEPYYSAEEVEELLGRQTGAQGGRDLER